jgi:hypothetical protein
MIASDLAIIGIWRFAKEQQDLHELDLSKFYYKQSRNKK